jgi:predicted permease
MRFLKRLHALLSRRRFDLELDEELRFHIDRAAEESGDLNEARRRFGNVLAVRESSRDLFTFARLEALWLDIRLGIRSLLRNPIMSAVAVLSLGLGIGATTTLYSLVDAILIHDVTARNAQQLFSFDSLSYPDYSDVRNGGVFDGLAAGNQCYPAPSWREGDRARQIVADCLSANFFEVVGGHAALGRTWTAEEAAAEREPTVAVIGHNFWQERLGGNPNIIGRTLTFDNTAFTVIGVLPADYRAIQGGGVDPDVYIPLNRALQPSLLDRNAIQVRPIGRLAADRTPQQTQQELLGALRELAQRFPGHMPPSSSAAVLTPVAGLSKLGQSQSDRSVVGFSAVLAAVTVFVLLIACVNVTGLLLARGVARQHEMAIRCAIGAGRLQLVRQLLVEAMLLAGAGTASGIGLTFLAAGFLRHVEVPVQDVTARFTFSPDWRFACWAAVLGVIVTVASGLVPALISSRVVFSDSLRVSRSTMTRRLPLRRLLVTAQISVSVVLLSGAFLFARNALAVLHYQLGFDSAHTVWFDMALDNRRPTPAQVSKRDNMYHALESFPEVQSVSWAWYLPFQLVYSQPVVHRVDGTGVQVIEQGIGPGYLKTMGIRLVAGREFDWRDLKPRDPSAPTPVLINEAFALAFFQEWNPVGERLVRARLNRDGSQLIVIGVSANTSFRTPGENPVPLMQSLSTFTPSLLVRGRGSADRLAAELSRVIEGTDPGMGTGYFTVRDRLDRATWPARAATVLLISLAAMGLILALTGLCGMSIYNVTRRTPEIGLRMALGADRRNILHLMLRDGLAVVAAGSAIGMICTLALARFVSGFLAAGISPWDPAAYTGVLATLFVASVGSIWFPCRRATLIDPSTSLRGE